MATTTDESDTTPLPTGKFARCHDIMLLQQVSLSRPWEGEYGTVMTIWAEVATELNRMPGFSMVKKPGALKTRFEYLLAKHEKGESASLRKSGTTEEYSERDQLLTDIKLRVDDFAENEAVRKNAAKRKQLEMSAKKTEDAEITPIKRRKKSKKPAHSLDIASLMGIIREGIEDKERREAQRCLLVHCELSSFCRIVRATATALYKTWSEVIRFHEALLVDRVGLDGTPEFICNGGKSTELSQSSTLDCKCLERLHLIGARCTDKGWQS
ncbi:hypothetical protein H257_02519 [Aphanomyces astaci]|uniref:Myb/SANT-like domain-containing protein n=1 Tax=Aphanomyces astaci TaxID=112090 RepID=W4H352_APHAT|nr:hypothetical protein H257_02519 [Aphanomyces astaci]ETV86031.1 hypothetical protein H257_02519 [Aphanomyces astaci]|eukprot:XP_009824503.1 hypothetical protein H257_02519 [Aphanomyces astaci]